MDNNPAPLRIAVIPRLIATLSYSIAAFPVLPIKSKSKTRWPAISILVVIQFVIAAANDFQMRTSWLWRVMEAESFG